MRGPGRYDAEAARVREETEATGGVVLIVVAGKRGEGFEVQVTPDVLIKLPGLLRQMATVIEADLYPSLRHTTEHPIPGGEM